MQPHTAALLLTVLMALAAQPSATQAAEQDSSRTSTQSTAQSEPKKAPRAKSKAEFDAYQSAAAEAEPAKLEAAATDFAQRYPASELRPFLFQRSMAMYQQANNSGKALEMARAVLKYDPLNSVALLCAAQILAEGAQEQDLDRDVRLQEAVADAQGALQHAGELTRPAGLNAEQFEAIIVELRGAAHEVLATVAYKRRDYRNAIDEYNAAVAGEKEHAGPGVWLRLAAAHEKMGEYNLAITAVEKAVAASEEGSPARELAVQEHTTLKALAAEAASAPATTPVATPGANPGATPFANQPVEKTENSRSPATGE